MAKPKQRIPAQDSTEPLTGREPYSPPRRNRLLLAISVILFMVWLLGLLWLAFS